MSLLWSLENLGLLRTINIALLTELKSCDR